MNIWDENGANIDFQLGESFFHFDLPFIEQIILSLSQNFCGGGSTQEFPLILAIGR